MILTTYDSTFLTNNKKTNDFGRKHKSCILRACQLNELVKQTNTKWAEKNNWSNAKNYFRV